MKEFEMGTSAYTVLVGKWKHSTVFNKKVLDI